jgi:hypothetical protein
MRQQAWLPGVPVRQFPLLCLFPREEHLFPKQKSVGRRLILRASTRPSRSPYCTGATLRVCLCAALFSPRRLDLSEARFRHISARPPFGQRLNLP